MPMADLGACNPIPKYKFQYPEAPTLFDDNVPIEERHNMIKDARVSMMPYLPLDQYNRNLQVCLFEKRIEKLMSNCC